MATNQKKKASTQKVKAAVENVEEVPVEESKSEEEPQVVLSESKPAADGESKDSKPAKDSGDGSDNASAEVAAPKRVTSNLWTS